MGVGLGRGRVCAIVGLRWLWLVVQLVAVFFVCVCVGVLFCGYVSVR